MAPKGSLKGKGKATARVKMPTSVINQRVSSDQDLIKGFFSEQMRGLIQIYDVCAVKNNRVLDLFYDIFNLDPVTTCRFAQCELMWQHRRSRSSPFREWLAAFRSYMVQLFDKTHDQMNNWRGENPHAFRDEVNRSDLQTTRSGKVNRTVERFSWSGTPDLRAKIEPPRCRQYKQGHFLAVRPPNWDETHDADDDDENWADSGAPSCGRSCPRDGNGNDNDMGEEDTEGGEIVTGKENGTHDGKGIGKRKGNGMGKVMEEGKGKGNGTGKGIVEPTAGGDDISRAIALQLQRAMYEADSDMEA